MANVVDPYTASPGAVIAAAEINARIAAIIAQVNGNIETANIKDASVTKLKLASDALQNFLQLLAPGTRKVAFGTSTWTWPGGVWEVGQSVAHGLGVTPIFALAIPTNGGSIFFNAGGGLPVGVFPRGHSGADATNIGFHVGCGFAPGAGGTTTFQWIAIA